MSLIKVKSTSIDGTLGDEARPNSKPLFVNGNMAIAQRAVSKTGQTGSGYFTCDRWGLGNSSLGTYTITQSSDAPNNTGLSNSYKLDCTTADASPSAGDRLYFYYQFEGRDVQLLEKGTSDAKKSTLAFWVKSAKTGTYTVQAYDNDNGRAVSVQYTISSANTWEHKVLVIPADTTGAYGNDNGSSLIFLWYLGAGTNRTSGTLQTSWASDVAANTAVGNVNLSDSTSNDWYITGVQLEVGEFTSATLPPFQHESSAENEMRCMRYYQNTWNTVNGQYPVSTATQNTCITTSWNDGNAPFQGMFPVQMRSTPTVTLYARGDGASGNVNQNGSNKSCSPADTSEKTIGYLNVSSGTNLVYTAWHHVLDAEL